MSITQLSDVQDHPVELVASPEKRQGIGLCLSGGGFRATLFHLGALRRLAEVGVLSHVRTVSAVSGGSIAAAHLATVLAKDGPVGPSDWDQRVAKPLIKFTAADRRTKAILRRFLPWNWFRSSAGVEGLAAEYARNLTALRLDGLPKQPNFVFCATDLQFGVNFVFERGRMGDYRAGYVSPPPADWPLAKAVAASSCFPPVFNPLPVRLAAERFVGGSYPNGVRREALVAGMRLTDGGAYDNLGLEPVWKSHEYILVSDGGAPFDVSEDRGLLWRIGRYVAVVDNQARALRKRWLLASLTAGDYRGAYWSVRSATTSYSPGDRSGYTKPLATDVISRIRTDLDAFSEAEAAVLENHGYWLAEAALRSHSPDLIPAAAPSPKAPRPEWMDEARVREALWTSHRRRL